MGINDVKQVCLYFVLLKNIYVYNYIHLVLYVCHRKNISYSAMCNSAGQAFGIFLGNILLIMLTSESFWNKWWRTSPLPDGLITLQGMILIIHFNRLYK